jgi:metal-responsive CopG/Arc/MetJ family transcriptional regulator
MATTIAAPKVRVEVVLTSEQVEALDRVVRKHGGTRAALIRQIVLAFTSKAARS